MTEDQLSELKTKITRLKGNLNVNQITISRIVKSKNGDQVFVSLSANYGEEGDSDNKLPMEDISLATHLLGREVNILAYEQALAGGLINQMQFDEAQKYIKGNYTKLFTKG
jgi:hypothetical protein